MESSTRFRLKIKPFFKWFDIWVGIYIDRAGKAIYICPIPTVGIKIWWWTETLTEAAKMAGWKESVDYIEAHIKMDKDPLKAIESAKAIVKELL